MTTCVAAACDDGKAIVLVADKMVGLGYVESEPDISKIQPLHKSWRVMIAGNGIEPAFDVIHAAREKLACIPSPSLCAVMSELAQAYQAKRLSDAEALFLAPIGWSLERFRREGKELLSELEVSRILQAMREHEYELELLVGGFDETAVARIFSVSSHNRGIPQRHDLGFEAVGSGSTNARFIMTYRKYNPTIKVREALYYALEGKYYGELASGVGTRTDAMILRPDASPIMLDEEATLDVIFDEICSELDPREFKDKHLKILNRIPEMSGFPLLKLKAERDPKKKREKNTQEWWKG